MFPADKPPETLCFFSNFLNIPLYPYRYKTKGHIHVCGLWFYADNFFLPFNLLAAKTFLPPFVLILALNP